MLPRNIYIYTLNLDILPNTPTYASQWTNKATDIVAYAIQSYKRLPGSPFRGEPVSVLTNAPMHAAILYPVLLEVIS